VLPTWDTVRRDRRSALSGLTVSTEMAGWHPRTRGVESGARGLARDSCATDHGTRCGSMAGGKSMPTVAAKIQHQFLATHTLLTCPHIPPQKAARAAQICKARAHTCPRKQARTRSRPPARPSFSVTHARAHAHTHARALAHAPSRTHAHNSPLAPART